MRKESSSITLGSPTLEEAIQAIENCMRSKGQTIDRDEIDAKIRIAKQHLGKSDADNDKSLPGLPDRLLSLYNIQIYLLSHCVRRMPVTLPELFDDD